MGEGPHHSEIQKLNRYNVIDSLEIPDMSHRSTALLCWDYESFHDLAEECRRAIQFGKPKSYLTSQDDMVFFESTGTQTIQRAIW